MLAMELEPSQSRIRTPSTSGMIKGVGICIEPLEALIKAAVQFVDESMTLSPPDTLRNGCLPSSADAVRNDEYRRANNCPALVILRNPNPSVSSF